MGNFCSSGQTYVNGVISNESLLTVEYLIYGKMKKLGTLKIQNTINPKIDIGVELEGAKLNLEGFRKQTNEQINFQYEQSIIQVQPNRFSTSGLKQLQKNQHRISVRIRAGEYVKYLQKNVVVKHQSDICLKIRQDLSIKNLQQNQIKNIIGRNYTITQQFHSFIKQKQKQKQKYFQQKVIKVLKEQQQLVNKMKMVEKVQ